MKKSTPSPIEVYAAYVFTYIIFSNLKRKLTEEYYCRSNRKLQKKIAVTRLQAAVVIVVVIAAVAAGAYFATSRGPTGPTAPATATIQNPDTLTQEIPGAPDNVDPALDYDYYGYNVIENVYEPLLQYRADILDRVFPWLAESYDVSPDGRTWTFHLRSGIKFSDGTPLDAQAVWYSYMRVLIIDDPGSAGWLLAQVVRGGANYSKSYNNAGPSAPEGYGDAYTKAELDDLLNAKPVEVIDPMTVAFHIEWPYADWLWIMAYDYGPVSPTAFKAHWSPPTDGTPCIDGITAGDYGDVANPWPLTNMVGTGPYMLSSWDKASGEMILIRNENYWGGPDNRGLAPIKNIIIKWDVIEANTRILDLKVGVADTVDVPVAGGLIFQFVDRDTWVSQGKLKILNPDFAIFPQCPPAKPVEGKCLFPLLQVHNIFLVESIWVDRKPAAFQPFQDVRIRKAFTLSFNRTAYYHDIMQGFEIPGNQLITPQMLGYDPTIQLSPYDPAQAKQLLLDAGAHPIFPDNAFSPENPKTISICYSLGELDNEQTAQLIASAISSYSSDTGLYAKSVGLAKVQFRTSYRVREFAAYMSRAGYDYPGPDDNLPFMLGRTGTWTRYIGYNNPEVFKLIDEQSKILDSTERAKVISQITKMTNDEYVYLWRGYQASFTLSRSWLHERPNASIASGLETFNAGVTNVICCYYYEIQKGGSTSPASMQPSFLELIQLPVAHSAPKKSPFFASVFVSEAL